MKLAILIPKVWSVRNVVLSGVLTSLGESGARSILIMKGFPQQLEQPEHKQFLGAVGYEPMMAPTGRPARGAAFLDNVIRSGFNRRNHIRSYSIYRRWQQRQNSIFRKVRSWAFESIGSLAQPDPVFTYLCRHAETIYRKSHDLRPMREQLERIAPNLLWSTVSVAHEEYPYILAARDLGIPVVTSILSFDNLTSRSVLARLEHYLVWSQHMKDQLLRLYPQIQPEQVTATGTPQFDFHRRDGLLWSRRETLKRLGMEEGEKYFLYATSNDELAPGEPRLLEEFIQRMEQDETLKDYLMVVRIHPLDRWEKWEAISKYSRAVLSPALTSGLDAVGLGTTSLEDQARLVSSLAHAEGCINIASTIALDAAILDRPVIGIDFSTLPGSPGEILYEEYGAEHYLPLVESGGVRVAVSWPELLDLMRQAIRQPYLDQERRRRMVETQCGLVDGRASDRVVWAITALLAGNLGSQIQSRLPV